MRTVEIPIKDKKNPPILKFPDRCVRCGMPKQIVLPMKLNMGVKTKRGPKIMDVPVPLCTNCNEKEKKVTYITLIPFMVSGLIFGVIAFIPAWLLSPDGVNPATRDFPVYVGLFAALFAGVIGGTLTEFILKLLFKPFFGQLLVKRPLTVISLFNDSEDVVGLSMRFTENKKSLLLTFENDDTASEFIKLNELETK